MTAHVPRPSSLPDAGDRFVVVEASAGTGKTYFLEHRVVDLILRADAQLGQILLVTFTDKAVAELRMRIRDLLDRLSRVTEPGEPAEVAAEALAHCWIIDDAARAKLRAAVTAFDHAPIFTIHGFCHRVLLEDAFAARRLFDQTQVADEVAFDAAFAALLRERFARVSPDRDLLRAFLETDRSIDRLRELLLRCARADALPQRRLDPATVDAAVESVRGQFGTAPQRAGILALLASERRWLAARLDAIGGALARCPAGAATPQQLAFLDEIRETAGMIGERASKLTAPVLDAVRGAMTTISLDEAIAGELLPAILDRIGADKAEHGLFDYDDMLDLVWEALRGPRKDELATRLRTRTPWAMIDEFQDTDPVQWQIFRSVWMDEGARGLTIVGDPKQAIYGFRGADVATYVAARDEMYRAGATRVALTVNRRSTEALVTAVNQILVGTPLSPLLDKTITYDEPVSASGDITSTDLRPPIAVFALQGKGTAESNRAALAGAIGAAIEALRRAPPEWHVRGEPRPFALGQVMVLTRSNRDSVTIAAALRARGLPCALVEPERLFATREAAELAAVLAAVAAPRDRSARLRALRTRFFDVPWGELMRVVDAPDHHPPIARLFDWAQLGARRAYEALFRRIVEDSRYAERALVLGGGERAVTNTWHLIELLLDEVSRARCDLHELAHQLRRWIDDDTTHTDERDVQRADSDADAIRVLTIHKAKGLEAPFVFLFGGASPAPKSAVQALRDPTGHAGSRALVVGTPDARTQLLLDAEADAENQRLAYVALTRAMVRLYLPLYGEKGIADGAAYWPIQRCLTPWAARPLAPRSFEKLEIQVDGDDEPMPPEDALATLVVPAAPPPVELAPLAPLAPGRAGLAMLSYTRLAHQLDAAIAVSQAAAIDPAEFNIDDSAGEVGPNDLPPGAASGLMLHMVFEDADLELVRRNPDVAAWYAEPSVATLVADAARAHGVDRAYFTHAAAIVHATFSAPLALTDGSTLPPLVEATAFAREVEFTYPLPDPDRGLVRGYIDALVAWDSDLWVLDYKSDFLAGDRAHHASLAAERVRQDYMVQARLYAIAADRLAHGRRLAGLLFAFVRHDLVVPIRITPDSIAAWTRWLAEIPSPTSTERT